MHAITKGLLAGAAGTTALNITTYGDMLIRGRPASGTPDEVVGELAYRTGISPGDPKHGPNRETAMGALFGYATGLAVGAAYGAMRDRGGRMPRWLAGPALGAAAMAGSDVPAASLGVTRPTSWGTRGWVSDIVPHLVYGATTAMAYEAMPARRGLLRRRAA
ncbi:hypothetical protein [Streptomyces radicis]|uniref:DUF1440 domain-containing protein n=1 Tax=Streptomyces radicis TaxID=1750517 RepID=A0A3A9WJS2_9ACTN|nr:hypothetical protein [Streptomyces radicis]RKN09694.1 hypothetical protein D7319_11605 [Streptomyces radicis]RKN23332.1 hypothetical protein D7318_12560 [Streptomyces radicis]